MKGGVEEALPPIRFLFVARAENLVLSSSANDGDHRRQKFPPQASAKGGAKKMNEEERNGGDTMNSAPLPHHRSNSPILER